MEKPFAALRGAKQDRPSLSHAMMDRLLTLFEVVAGLQPAPPELHATDAERRLTWLLYCVAKNGWDAPVPPYPGDVTPKRERQLVELGFALDDPLLEVSIDERRDDTDVIP